MFGFKDGGVQRLATLVAVSPILKTMADFLAASAVWDTAYEMLQQEYTRVVASAKLAGVEVGSRYNYTPTVDADRNAIRIYDALRVHYGYAAIQRLTLARRALFDALEIHAGAYEFDLSIGALMSVVLPDRGDLVFIRNPIRVE